jgi:spore maturation protein CgeB
MKILIVRYKYIFDRSWKEHWVATGSALLDDALRSFAAPRGHTVDVFFFDDMILKYGRDEARKKLWEYVSTNKPDVCFAGFSEFDWGEELFQKMHDQQHTAFVYIGDDDTWRWERISRHFAKYFHWIVTYDSRAVKKYKSIGITNVIHHQPGANTASFRKLDGLEKDIDVSFAGLWSKPRARVINVLRDAGINVLVRGVGWPEGPVSQEELIQIMNRSKINLALNTASFYVGWRSISRLFLRRANLGEGGSSIKLDIWNFPDNVRSWFMKRNLWVKARNFEVPATGTFELTEDADDLRDYYKLGEEIVVYKSDKDLVEKVRYYLAHPEEREAIAKRGYERTIREHSIEKRYEDIFRMIGKPL